MHSFPTDPARRRLIHGAALAAAGTALPFLARSQSLFGKQPITLLVPYPAGGATDVQARALALAASRELKQQIVILNQPGVAATLAPTTMARKAVPDGYTLSLMLSSLYRLPHLQKVSYDPATDFTYVANVTAATLGITVRQDAPWKDLNALLAAAKAKPGEVSYGTTGRGGTSHVSMERLAALAGVKFNFIPFKGAAELYNALMGGHVDAVSEAGFGAAVAGGRVRLLATFNEARSPTRLNVPTVKELGYDVVANGSWGIAGPRGMDPKVVQALQEAFRKAVDDPEFLRTLDLNDYVRFYMDSPAYTAWAHKTYADEKRFVSDLRIKLDD
ncbi:tripartite-type tricarboxylate transporter receptor subunit TctC [Variovorax boronicumulans]|uniref:tripartite tricarboxylate transporter substrate binding protein n=1 Tax=Variovorax boronicumulans TaxID=436515 RepID=UPI0033907C73